MSPPFRRTTRRPAAACSTSRSLMADWGVLASLPPCLPTLMMCADGVAYSVRISGLTRRSAMMTSARCSQRSALTVSSSGSPGPAPMKITFPGVICLFRMIHVVCNRQAPTVTWLVSSMRIAPPLAGKVGIGVKGKRSGGAEGYLNDVVEASMAGCRCRSSVLTSSRYSMSLTRPRTVRLPSWSRYLLPALRGLESIQQTNAWNSCASCGGRSPFTSRSPRLISISSSNCRITLCGANAESTSRPLVEIPRMRLVSPEGRTVIRSPFRQVPLLILPA